MRAPAGTLHCAGILAQIRASVSRGKRESALTKLRCQCRQHALCILGLFHMASVGGKGFPDWPYQPVLHRVKREHVLLHVQGHLAGEASTSVADLKETTFLPLPVPSIDVQAVSPLPLLCMQ